MMKIEYLKPSFACQYSKSSISKFPINNIELALEARGINALQSSSVLIKFKTLQILEFIELPLKAGSLFALQ